MIYFIKWIFCWVFLFRAPHEHNYTAWHVIEDSTVTYSDGALYGIIVVKRACRTCLSEETLRHTTSVTYNGETYKALKSALRKHVLDMHGITSNKEDV